MKSPTSTHSLPKQGRITQRFPSVGIMIRTFTRQNRMDDFFVLGKINDIQTDRTKPVWRGFIKVYDVGLIFTKTGGVKKAS